MCELDDMNEFAQRRGEVSRRDFGALALGAGVVAALPTLANAMDTKGADVEIKTPDGTCDAYFVHPAKGKYPGVLIWPDIFGLRPAFKDMATRLAGPAIPCWSSIPFIASRRRPLLPSIPISMTRRRVTH
jgi:carboxymethylenebutenolidase